MQCDSLTFDFDSIGFHSKLQRLILLRMGVLYHSAMEVANCVGTGCSRFDDARWILLEKRKTALQSVLTGRLPSQIVNFGLPGCCKRGFRVTVSIMVSVENWWCLVVVPD